MTVILELEPEVEGRVRSRARSTGKTIEKLLLETIDEKFLEVPVRKSFFQTATDDEWEAAMESMAVNSDKIPLTWDDSRESIYR